MLTLESSEVASQKASQEVKLTQWELAREGNVDVVQKEVLFKMGI